MYIHIYIQKYRVSNTLNIKYLNSGNHIFHILCWLYWYIILCTYILYMYIFIQNRLIGPWPNILYCLLTLPMIPMRSCYFRTVDNIQFHMLIACHMCSTIFLLLFLTRLRDAHFLQPSYYCSTELSTRSSRDKVEPTWHLGKDLRIKYRMWFFFIEKWEGKNNISAPVNCWKRYKTSANTTENASLL